jgi:hypothetical protein
MGVNRPTAFHVQVRRINESHPQVVPSGTREGAMGTAEADKQPGGRDRANRGETTTHSPDTGRHKTVTTQMVQQLALV